ncbi:MAG: flagellar basal body protein FliL [Candidatus Dadabacteria bacterium]|nr:MAG: flagellar basal body protein FliL [Candidatus Dadabacteria bacterium]
MADEEKTEQAEGEEGAKPKSKKKLFIIIGAVVLLLVGGGVAFAFIGGGSSGEEGEDEQVEEHQEKHYETVEFDTFIVNLSANSSFLKVKLILEYDPELVMGGEGEGGGHAYGGGASGGGEGEGGLPGVLGEKEPQIRDAVIRVLSSKTAEEVLTQEGKEALKEELIEAINEATGLDEGPVVNIYFAEFIIQ